MASAATECGRYRGRNPLRRSEQGSFDRFFSKRPASLPAVSKRELAISEPRLYVPAAPVASVISFFPRPATIEAVLRRPPYLNQARQRRPAPQPV